jgi:hypothetical protein
MAFQHHAAAAESVRDDTIRSRFSIPPLYRQHPVWMGYVPGLAATTLFQARQHQLRAHRSIAHQAPFSRHFMQRLFLTQHHLFLHGSGEE